MSRNIQELRNYFFGKNPDLKETLADNSLKLIGIDGSKFALTSEVLALIDEVNQDIANLTNRVIDTEADIGALQFDLSRAKEDIRDLENALGNLETKHEDLEEVVNRNSTSINELFERTTDYYNQAIAYTDAQILIEDNKLTDLEALNSEQYEYTLEELADKQSQIDTLRNAVDTNVQSIADLALNKQRKLQAGDNITILALDDVDLISATGGSAGIKHYDTLVLSEGYIYSNDEGTSVTEGLCTVGQIINETDSYTFPDYEDSLCIVTSEAPMGSRLIRVNTNGSQEQNEFACDYLAPTMFGTEWHWGRYYYELPHKGMLMHYVGKADTLADLDTKTVIRTEYAYQRDGAEAPIFEHWAYEADDAEYLFQNMTHIEIRELGIIYDFVEGQSRGTVQLDANTTMECYGDSIHFYSSPSTSSMLTLTIFIKEHSEDVPHDVGETHYIIDEDTNYYWNGEEWVMLGVSKSYVDAKLGLVETSLQDLNSGEGV